MAKSTFSCLEQIQCFGIPLSILYIYNQFYIPFILHIIIILHFHFHTHFAFTYISILKVDYIGAVYMLGAVVLIYIYIFFYGDPQNTI